MKINRLVLGGDILDLIKSVLTSTWFNKQYHNTLDGKHFYQRMKIILKDLPSPKNRENSRVTRGNFTPRPSQART